MLRYLTGLLLIVTTASSAAAAPLIELTSNGKPVRGKRLAHNKAVCWLCDVDGRLVQVPLSTVTDFKQAADTFEGRPTLEVKKRLAAEFGPAFEIAARGKYVVAAPRGKADSYATLFDQTCREFLQYLKVRKFQVHDPDVPLVAVVYPTRKQFVAQCAKDDVEATPVLRGYYDLESNRVTLYDDPLEGTLATAPPGDGGGRGASRSSKAPQANSGEPNGSDRAKETAVHEAIHQIAFNAGLHSRLGGNPLWIVEGLAMQFERGKDGFVKTRSAERVNVPRMANFEEYRRERRKSGAVAQLIAADDLLKTAPLDGYAESWLLTNYLIETRSQKFGWYLQTLAARNPLDPYPPEERLQDFQANFGKDLDWLDVEFLRYAEKVAAEAMSARDLKKK